jgi:hypothetical protein
MIWLHSTYRRHHIIRRTFKIQDKYKLATVHNHKAYEVMDELRQAFLTSAIDGGGWSASRRARLTSGAIDILWKDGWVRPRTVTDFLEIKRKNHGSSVIQPVAWSQYFTIVLPVGCMFTPDIFSTNRGSFHSMSKRFFSSTKLPNWSLGPPNLLSSGYKRLIPRE